MTADLTARITEILRALPSPIGAEPFTENDDGAPMWLSCLPWELLLCKVAKIAAAAAEEHYRPRVETPERLDALPVGAIVADLHCDLTPPPVYVRFIDGWSLDGLKVKAGSPEPDSAVVTRGGRMSECCASGSCEVCRRPQGYSRGQREQIRRDMRDFVPTWRRDER